MGILRDWKCDRYGGQNFARYMRRKPWTCPHCDHEQTQAGHHCIDCHRRICCSCFHHDIGICLSGGGSDVKPCFPVAQSCPGPRMTAQASGTALGETKGEPSI